MKPTENNAKTPYATGRFALRGAFLHAKGTGVSVAVLVVLVALISTTSAQAAIRHEYLKQITEVPTGKLGVEGQMQMTVDSGDLWVGEQSRVDEFDAAGGFLAQLSPPADVQVFTGGVAVGHATGETQVYVPAEERIVERDGLTEESVVEVFAPTGALLGTLTGAETPGESHPSKSFGLNGVRDVAVDNSTNPTDWAHGDMYATDTEKDAVLVFEPEADGKAKYLTEITGISPTEPFPTEPEPFYGPERVAVDESNGDLVVSDGSVVDVFEPTVFDQYEFVRQLTGTPSGLFGSINGVAVDGGGGEGSGDIYVAQGSEEDQFSGAGAYLGRLTGTPAGAFPNNVAGGSVNSVAVDPSSHQVYVGVYKSIPGKGEYEGSVEVFGPNVVVPDVAITEPVSELTPTSVTLRGTVNPVGAGEATCTFEYGTTTAYGTEAECTGPGSKTHPVPNGNAAVPVEAVIPAGKLQPDTTYYYHLDAVNADRVTNTGEGPEDVGQFTTPGPGIEEQSAAAVTSSSATLNATIDPHNGPSSASHGAPESYYFQYSTAPTAGCEATPSSCADLPIAPGVSLPIGESGLQVSQHVQGLAAATVYHYRVVVVGEIAGRIESFDGPDATFTTQPTGGAFALPDGRQWELVSPPDKHGALVLPIEESGVVQAAVGGSAFTYLTDGSPELQPRGISSHVQVLSTRGSGGWSSQDIDTPHNYQAGIALANGYEYRFFSPDLSQALVEPTGLFTPLSNNGVSEEVPPEAAERAEDVRSDFTCQATPVTCYTPLVTPANTLAGVRIGGQSGGAELHAAEHGAVRFAGATPDLSHVVLASSVVLTSEAPLTLPGLPLHNALYEWSGGQLQLVSVLPPGEGGAGVQGTFGVTCDECLEARNAISGDGSRVVWSTPSSGSVENLYMRDTVRKETVRIGEVGVYATFKDASSDDSKVFFTQQGNTNLNGGAVGGDLYVFEVTSAADEPLTGKVTRLTENAEVQGTVIGASEDGSYVYFAANGVLGDGAQRGATSGDCEGGTRSAEESQTCNLYVDHYSGSTWEAPAFIATLSGGDNPDWDHGEAFNLRRLTARVSPDGHWLAFMSQRSLTGYDNTDVNEATGKHADEEVYLYDAVERKLVCASCNPTGARPHGEEYEKLESQNGGVVGGVDVWESTAWLAANVPGWIGYEGYGALYQPRYLSDRGRLFFNSDDALVPQDVNGTWDVYEYEPPGNGEAPPSDTCTTESSTYSSRSAGCVNLISLGESAEESAFLDASENGDDVFFLTTSRLSSQDIDNDYDVYDAHVCGAEGVACTTSLEPPPPCTTEASCKPSPEPQPGIYGLPSSATFSGPGNLAPPLPTVVKKVTKKTVKCKKPKKLSHGKCVKPKKKTSNKRGAKR